MLKDNLRKFMEKRGLSGLELAARSGVPQARISEILTGKTLNPHMKTLKRLASGLEITVTDLIMNHHVAESTPLYQTSSNYENALCQQMVEEFIHLDDVTQLEVLADIKRRRKKME